MATVHQAHIDTTVSALEAGITNIPVAQAIELLEVGNYSFEA